MRAPAAESVAPSLIDDSANLFGKDSIVHQRETDDSDDAGTDESAEDYSEIIPDDVKYTTEPLAHEAVTEKPLHIMHGKVHGPRGYKPGTRLVETPSKAVIAGARPWWGAPRGDAVWAEKAEQFKAKGGIETKNIIGWRDTGLTGGAGR